MFVKMHRVMCFIVTALLILLQISCQNSVEKQFLCKNEDCTEPIGKFSVKLNYNADSSGKLSAKAKDEGIILARPKDKSTNLWKVKIQDKIGFMPNSHILEFKKWEANITVKLSIPADSVSNSDFSNTPTTSDHNKDVEKHIGANDASVTKISTDDVNSSVPNVEEIRNESVSTIVNDSSNETNNVDINKDSNSTLDPLLKTDSTTDPNTTPSNDESTNKDTTVNQSDNKSLENQLPPIVEDQFEPIGLKKESHVPDIPIKLENISVEVNESEVVNVIKESEIIAESSTNINRKLSENLTQEIDIEKDILAGEISNTSESISSHIETLNDTTSSSSDANNTPTKNNTAPDISKKTEVPNDPSVNGNAVSQDEVQVISKPSPESNISAPVDDHVVPPSDEVQVIAKPSPESNISAPVDDHAASPSAEAQVIAKPSPESNISAPVDDHAASPSAEAQVIAKPSSESNISTSVDSSLNSSATPEVFNNFGGDVKQSSDDDKPVQATSIPVETVTSEETSAEFNHEIPMRSFPNDKKPPAAPEKSDISSEEIIIATESENENVTSEEISPSLNSTHNLDSNETETENIIEGTQQHDSVTPKAIPSDVYPPPNIEGTTEIGDIKAPTSAEEIFDSNESVPLESPTIPSGSPAAEDSPLSKLSEPYKYIKSPPYPGMLPNIVTESQPSVTEKSDEVSSQEIIETEPEAISDSSSQASGPVSASFNAEQKQGLNDFIHSSRAKVTEDEPEPISESETLKEKSIYETIGEFLPDFSLLAEKLNSLFDFGSTSPKEAPEIETKSEFCSAEQFCGTDHLNSHMDTPANPESENILEVPFLGVVSKEQVTYVSGILTSVFIATILLWWLMNYFNKSKKTGLLISRINQLENKLLISTREIASLQEKLVEQDCQAESKQNAADIRRITEVYEHKINQYKKRIVELDDKVLYLEKELENVSNSALEMHKLLENSLATQAQSKLALDEVETLRTLTENQEIQIDELKKEINSVVTENECLKVDNEMNKSNIKKLEKECNAQTKKNVELSEKNRSLTLLLDKELENNTVLEGNYKTEMYELRSKLEDIEMNFKRSEFQVQELQRAILDKQDTVHGSSNDVQLRIQISTLEAMNNELSGQLNEQKNARRMLEEHVGDITKELNNLKKSFENSEKERNQAVTKLQVLTQYFKDKEEQLHRELETKDKLSLERESKDQSLTQKLSLMREEISNLKTQNEELRKEVLDQEASYKVQLANAEQKTREHWFALRQAERKYKESQQEAAILRNKILVLETNMSSISLKADDKNNSGLNGDIPGSSSILYHPSLSPDLLPYPSPSDFIPPPPSPIPSHSPDFFPPEPIYSPDERLPPLGGRRGPSPPPPVSPDDDFSPPPPVMKYAPNRSHNVEPPIPGGYSRRTPPPSGRHRSQYKSRPPRSSIDSPSSGMSLESLDKSGR